MAMVILENLLDILTVQDLRENFKEGADISVSTNDSMKKLKVDEGEDYSFRLQLSPAKGDNKKIFEGTLWYPKVILGSLRHPSINVYGCLCNMKPDKEGRVHQGISLKKIGRYLTPKEFKMIDYALGKFLGKRILPQLLDVEIDLKRTIQGSDGGYKEIYVAKNPGLWGKQSCNEFAWRDESLLRLIELKDNPDPTKRGPYMVCGNCSKGDDCKTHIQIKANRKRQPEVPVEVEVGQ